MATLKLSILSPERRLLEEKPVDEVTLNGSEGQIQILPGHAAMVGTLEKGEFHYHPVDGNRTGGVIASGFFQVHDDHVNVLAESLELLGESHGGDRAAHA